MLLNKNCHNFKIAQVNKEIAISIQRRIDTSKYLCVDGIACIIQSLSGGKHVSQSELQGQASLFTI